MLAVPVGVLLEGLCMQANELTNHVVGIWYTPRGAESEETYEKSERIRLKWSYMPTGRVLSWLLRFREGECFAWRKSEGGKEDFVKVDIRPLVKHLWHTPDPEAERKVQAFLSEVRITSGSGGLEDWLREMDGTEISVYFAHTGPVEQFAEKLHVHGLRKATTAEVLTGVLAANGLRYKIIGGVLCIGPEKGDWDRVPTIGETKEPGQGEADETPSPATAK